MAIGVVLLCALWGQPPGEERVRSCHALRYHISSVSSEEYLTHDSLTVQLLNCFSVQPVQLKCRLLGYIIWLHYGSCPVGVGQAEDMANFMDSHLEGTQTIGVVPTLGPLPSQGRPVLRAEEPVKQKGNSGGELSQRMCTLAWRSSGFPDSCILRRCYESVRPLTLRRLMPTSLVGGVKCSSSSKWISPRRQACANSCPLPSKTRGQPRCRPGQGRGRWPRCIWMPATDSPSQGLTAWQQKQLWVNSSK